jgi:hypothetical protein
MNYRTFTNESLIMMHHGARGALAVDDELHSLGKEPRFRVRETADWKTHADGLESEMAKRGMIFDVIDWSKNRTQPPALPNPEPCYPPIDSSTLLSNRIAAIIKK